MYETIPRNLLIQNIIKQVLPSCADDVIWSHGLHSSNWLTELQVQVPKFTFVLHI